MCYALYYPKNSDFLFHPVIDISWDLHSPDSIYYYKILPRYQRGVKIPPTIELFQSITANPPSTTSYE